MWPVPAPAPHAQFTLRQVDAGSILATSVQGNEARVVKHRPDRTHIRLFNVHGTNLEIKFD